MGDRLPTFEDAYDKETLAKERLEKHDYAGAIFNAQLCVEFALKALFDVIKIPYAKEHHFAEGHFQNAMEKLGKLFNEDWKITQIREKLARSEIWAALLGRIRNYAEGYVTLSIPVNRVFDFSFKELAEAAIKEASSILSYWRSINYEIQEARKTQEV